MLVRLSTSTDPDIKQLEVATHTVLDPPYVKVYNSLVLSNLYQVLSLVFMSHISRFNFSLYKLTPGGTTGNGSISYNGELC